MKKNSLITLTLTLTFLSSYCGAQSQGFYDKNQDGENDVFYKYNEDGSYIEAVDSNYDKSIDERCMYDANDTLVFCTYDQDFNGVEETRVEYEMGTLVKEGVDLDGDQFYEIIFYYVSGVLFEGFRHYENKDGKQAIGNVKFRFGYPSNEEIIETKLSGKEFSEQYWSNK